MDKVIKIEYESIRLDFDKKLLENFIDANDFAILKGDNSFRFKGELFLVDYAKQLIEYLESELSVKQS